MEVEFTLVGVCTDICVISNALLLKAHYPEMKIVVDASCCAGSSPEKHYMALEVMKSCHIDVINNEYDRMKENALQLLSKAYGVPIDIIYPESEG
jgi:nicotinamidase-related amidase